MVNRPAQALEHEGRQPCPAVRGDPLHGGAGNDGVQMHRRLVPIRSGWQPRGNRLLD
ncbi:hypothetical protein D3C72_2422780 [compost metagenome]